jgi:eukaryotic-like serine/threonine-protein kinase
MTPARPAKPVAPPVPPPRASEPRLPPPPVPPPPVPPPPVPPPRASEPRLPPPSERTAPSAASLPRPLPPPPGLSEPARLAPDRPSGPEAGLPGPGQVVAEKYRVERVLGRGGMGIVVEARHLELDERVAIKFLLPALGSDAQALVRFEREARAAFRIQSEHVVRVFDVGRLPEGTPFIVMEFLEGEDLAQLIGSPRELSIAEAIGLVLEASEALSEAHALGIVHRDLKPENLFVARRVDGSPCLKVLDFGLSKFSDVHGARRPRAWRITGTQQQLGTPNYMAPEQWREAHEVGPAADQWALGAILYELIAGAPAFGGDNMASVCVRVMEQPAAPLGRWRDDVPPELEAAVGRALAKDPAGRFPSLLELAQALGPFGPPHADASLHRIAAVLGAPRASAAAGAEPARASDAGAEPEPSTKRSVPPRPPAAAPPPPAPPAAPSPPTSRAAPPPPAPQPPPPVPQPPPPAPQPPPPAPQPPPPAPSGDDVPEEAPTRKNWVAPLAEPPPEERTRKNWQRVLDEGPRRARMLAVVAVIVGLVLTAIGVTVLLMNR